MKRKLVLSLIATLFVAAGCAQNVTEPNEQMGDNQAMEPAAEKQPASPAAEEILAYLDLEPYLAKDLIDTSEDLIIIDVSPDYAQGHLPGAINYYLGDGSLDQAIPTLDMEKEYLVYCHLESASRAGAQKLIDAGFKKVYRLNGDYEAWLAAGYPVE